MRLAAYAGVSVTLAAGVVLKALHQRSNFYAAAVYLSQSNANLMILTNLFLVASGFFLYGLQRLLYGPLRPIETEQLYEKAWFAVTETCLAMTIFRGELGVWFLVMFVCLLIGKVWGWIGEGRVEILDQQPPANPRLFHARLASSLVLSVVFDALMLDYAVKTVLDQARADMMVMFGFEFAILTILSTSTLARYGLSLMEMYVNYRQKKAKLEERRAELRSAREQAIREHHESGGTGLPDNLPNENDVDELDLDIAGWEEKGRWVFYLDLITDFCKLVVYLTFFAILFTFFGLPIHILRDVVVTVRSFGRRLVDFMRYRTATRDMNERYPDATPEEIAREDVCIICREDMAPWQQPAPGGNTQAVPDRLRPKKLPCGHILHFACLRSWLERQQNCPTCRRPVVVPANQPYQGNGANNDGRQNGAPGAQPAANQPGNGVNNNNAGAGQPRARVYQLGPFRIGFGAGRGDVFQNLHQQIHGNNAAPVNVQPGAQQIGFGFGFGRPHAAPPLAQHPQTNWASIQNQLTQIEQQIAQEYQSLRATADQLNVLRVLQTDLQRLRAGQQQQNPVPTDGSTQPSTSAAFSPSISVHSVANSLSSPIPAGDSRLPQGLVLPPGWTLTPLRRVEPSSSSPSAAQAPPSTSTSMPTPIDPQLFETPARPAETSQPDTSQPTSPPQESHSETQGEDRARRIWPSSLRWSANPNGHLPGENTISESTVDGASEETSPADKGKARAVTVEDASDEEGEDED
ncbi:E3 ubiquitin-protein ligase synoviolin [Talaromyces islandicus]|uniref:RING-type E3 ubiquitin transferase n=1 Tax=Talaromyces islandicus TaxID=28573 RepID=A0A0U1M8Y1_TALIS|nr:E3 ubiquitin-protein ligase synoviolin [Talaromyces islandicus]